jgi:hypothetical protein
MSYALSGSGHKNGFVGKAHALTPGKIHSLIICEAWVSTPSHAMNFHF